MTAFPTMRAHKRSPVDTNTVQWTQHSQTQSSGHSTTQWTQHSWESPSSGLQYLHPTASHLTNMLLLACKSTQLLGLCVCMYFPTAFNISLGL